jgi:glycosyltransferase involved in cell wall biosynthesis
MSKPTLIIIGAVPPPVHGVTISTSLVLDNPSLWRRFQMRHVDTSDPRPADTLARWDWQNVRVGLVAAWHLLRLTSRGPRGLVYLPLSGGTPGLMRDALYIHIAAARGWAVAGHLRGGEFHHYFRSLPWPLSWWIRFTMRRLASIGAMGESLKHMFSGVVDDDRVAVVTNGTPDVGFGPFAPRDGDTVLFLSNLRRRKGVLEAMQAARLVLERRPATRFVFAGPFTEDDTEAELRALAAPIAHAVDFVGRVDDEEKNELLRSAGVLLFPPKEPEGHPRVVLEGIAAGIPIVTTDRGAISETVQDGESAFILGDPEPELIAQRLLQLLDDPALRERMGRAARDRYEAEFTQQRADERFADWLVGLAGATDPR